jgi:hypothetical protein
VLAEAPQEPVNWLQQWPANRRSTLANLFYAAIRKGSIAPPAIIEALVADINQKLRWTADFDKRQFWCQVLNILADDPHAAQAYAGEVLAVEQLPPEEKAIRKAERSKAFALQAMTGQEATQKQHWMLRSLGFTEALPADRAAASEMIDRLLRERGRL